MKLTVYCLFILYFTNMSYTYLDELEQGCQYNFDKQKCLIETYCNFVIDLNWDILSNYERCHSENQYWHETYYIPVTVILKNMTDSTLNINDQASNIIVSLDISGNHFKTLRLTDSFDKLKVLNISHNALTSANLYNVNELFSIEAIDFSHNSIGDIVTESHNAHVFTTLVNLTLSYNHIKALKDNHFTDLCNLRYLDFSHNHIATISSHTFEGITALLLLQLSYNNIGDLNFLLLGLTALQELYLNNNNIKSIFFADFENMLDLKVLDLSYNSIVVMEENVLQNIPLLIQINLNHNLLTNISTNIFSNNLLLHNVNLSHNKLTNIPKNIFDGKNISIFSTEHNYLGGTISQGMFKGLKSSVLNLSNQAFVEIGQFAFLGLEDLTDLLLNNNIIETISDNAFRTLLNLNKLDLTNNKIKNINFYKEDLKSLKFLLLGSNYITQITSNHLKSLHTLEFLDLSNNNISQIETESFMTLHDVNNFEIFGNPLIGHLEANTFEGLILVPTLDLSCTVLDAVKNNSLDGMISLVELNVSYSKINVIQYNAFFNTGDIKILDLSHNKIESFCVNTTHLRNLNKLFLNNNLIKSLSSDFVKGMVYLNTIIVSYNSISHVSSDAFHDQKDLSYLDLSNNTNLLCEFSVFKEAKNLDTLILSNTISNISFNDYKDIPITMLQLQYSNISNLIYLNLSRLKNIIFLSLSHNSLSQLEVGSFSNLTHVSEIDISFNKISVIQPGVFKDNSFLNKLNMSHNTLLEIGYGVFRGLDHLKILDVSFNYISSLESESFFEVESLTELVIDHNKIKNISLEDLGNTNISVLSIGDNPISCKILSNLVKYKHSQLSITAIRYVDTIEHNSYGITCDINNFKSELSKTPRNGNNNDNILLDIRDILSDLNLKQTLNNDPEKTVNFSKLEILQEHSTKEVVQLQHFVTKLYNETNTTNTLLERILKVIVAKNSIDKPLQNKNNTSSENFFSYISEIKKDIINEMTIDKQRILAEVDRKLSMLNISFDTVIASPAVPLVKSESRVSSTTETKSPVFVETCVALILIILVCIILRKVYKSKMYILRGRSISTRQISDAMDTSDV